MQACHQIIGSFANRDAVGSHTVEVQRTCRSLGLRSEIFTLDVADGVTHPTHRLQDLPADDGSTVLMYQASASSPAAEVILGRSEPVLVNYHNVTPASFFGPWEPIIAHELLEARRQIGQLARQSVAGIADSRYNADELSLMGCPQVELVPVLIDTDRLSSTRPWTGPTASGSRWLFVGRLCPNKAQHDVIKSFALYRRLFDPAATLDLVGRSSSHRYQTALHQLVQDLQLDEAVRVTGSVSEERLGEHYRSADVFVCLSEHEGFCNTVVEAMATGTPVVAYASSAIPETVGSGALLLEDKDPLRVATAVRRVVTDRALREALIGSGRTRVAELSLPVARAKLTDVLRRLLAR